MYQSRIKQEIRRKSLLLPAVGEAPRPASPSALAALAAAAVNSTRGYYSAAGTVHANRRRSPRLSPLNPSNHITARYADFAGMFHHLSISIELCHLD